MDNIWYNKPSKSVVIAGMKKTNDQVE